MRPDLVEFEIFNKQIVVESYVAFNLVLNPLIFILLSIYFLNKLTGNIIRSVISALLMTSVVLFGARLFWYIGVVNGHNWQEINPFELYAGRLTMAGGFVFAVLFLPLMLKINKVGIWSFLDAITPGWSLGIGFNKIGCFLNGCCMGIDTDSIFGMRFPILNYPNPVFPVQLYESASGFIGFALVMLIRRRQKADGLSFSFFAFYFAVVRLLLNFIKEMPSSMSVPPILLPVSYAILIIVTGYLFAKRISAHNRNISKPISA
jgi:phosphatidylglycerol:prolipoprotein diacylglycerol transferase